MKKFCCLFLFLLICLSGCVRYDVGINFAQVNRGTIIQHIKLGEQLTSFSKTEGNAWLNSIQKRALQLQGKTKKISEEEIVVTIPFYNGQELVSKFNQFFNPSELNQKTKSNQFTDLLKLKAEMSIRQSNLLLLERNVLNVRADLRPLGVLSEEGNIIISPGDLIDLELKFSFPWWTKLVQGELSPPAQVSKHQVTWRLQPGQINQIKTIFWLPNYVGLGSVAIALLIIVGFYLKYKKLPLIN
jgi:hypothetical protein